MKKWDDSHQHRTFITIKQQQKSSSISSSHTRFVEKCRIRCRNDENRHKGPEIIRFFVFAVGIVVTMIGRRTKGGSSLSIQSHGFNNNNKNEEAMTGWVWLFFFPVAIKIHPRTLCKDCAPQDSMDD